MGISGSASGSVHQFCQVSDSFMRVFIPPPPHFLSGLFSHLLVVLTLRVSLQKHNFPGPAGRGVTHDRAGPGGADPAVNDRGISHL